MAYANIEKCGIYQDNCREWSRKTRSDKTWINFKAQFAQDFKETRRYLKTSKTKGYAAHVHAAQSNAALFTKMQQDHTLALANITTAIQADRKTVALLMKTISELSRQVAHLTAKLATAQAENARLKIGKLFNHGQVRTSGVHKFDPVRFNLKPRSKCVLQNQIEIRT